jgi:hypothetical protein
MYKILGTKKRKKYIVQMNNTPRHSLKRKIEGFLFSKYRNLSNFFFSPLSLISQNIVLHTIIHSLSYIIHTIIVDSHHAFILLRKGKIKIRRTNIKKTLNPLIYRLNFIEMFIIRTLWIYMDM